MKKRVLFVDDEVNVLQGLKRMLRPLRHEWEMYFTDSGEKALLALEKAKFHVVVSDMRMPGMDGAELLNRVKARHPNVVRIVLSGHSDQELILKSVGPAHQYLAKPCDAETLKATVARACALREILASDGLKQLVSQMDTLPSLPNLYTKVMEELNSEDCSIQKVGEIISQDVGMTAKILQLVNSAFFGIRKNVNNPSLAVSLLGIETVKALVLSVHVFSQFDSQKLRGINLDALWNHSMKVGTAARDICKKESADKQFIEEAFMAGMLHDAGKIILAANMPGDYTEVRERAESEERTIHEVERDVLGATHAEVGAYLLGLWGLPDTIVEALAFHHSPRLSRCQDFTPLTVVHAVDSLDYEDRSHGEAAAPDKHDEDYLRAVGVLDRLESWRSTVNGMEVEDASVKPAH